MKDLPRMDTPIEGYYRTRLVRGGPWVGVKIWFAPAADAEDRTPQWQCSVNGFQADVWEMWPLVGGREIDEAAYRKISPQAEAGKPVDKMKTKPIF
jgi:hypothetical protein